MTHSPGNKGNLNLLYKIFPKRVTWPLGIFANELSSCSIYNLMFIISELKQREDIPPIIHNAADVDSLFTNDVISILAESQKKAKIWRFLNS